MSIEVEEKQEKTPETGKRKRVVLKNKQAIGLLLIAAFGIWFIVAALAPNSRFFYVWHSFLSPMMFLLNILPILLLLGILYALTNRSVFSVVFSSSVFILLATVNRLKIMFRADPFIPADFTLASEVMDVLRLFETKYIILAAVAVVVFLVLLTGSLLFFRDEKKRPVIRIAILALSILIGIGANVWLYSDSDRYAEYPTNGSAYFKANEYSSKGFIYSFLVDYHKMGVEQPDNYSAEVYKELEEASETVAVIAEEEEETVKPHIIMIMGEAFADLEYADHISFEGYTDPLESFKQLKADAVLSGDLMVSIFGGGTAGTEFEALTGIPMAEVDNDVSPYQYIRDNLDSLPRFLESEGYDTLALHPGYSWFYNRINVYQYMGFDESIFLEDGFDLASENKGGYISEEVTMDRIIEEFDARLSDVAEDPLFFFSVTIQNHGPFEKKYNAETNFSTDLDLTDAEIDMMSNYFAGLADADLQLARLAEYLQTLSEPVILVYFGDHLPGFTGGMEFYSKLDIGVSVEGSATEVINCYRTPFMIWQNDAAAAANVLEEADVYDADDYLIKSHYLGATLYDLLGYEDEYPYFGALNDLREELPLLTNHFYMNCDGEFVDGPTEEQEEEIALLKGWAYYKMFEEVVEIEP